MSCKRPLSSLLALLALALAAQADDLHLKKNISVDGNVMSTSETFIKGARTRDVNQGMAGGMVTVRQCDLKRTITLNDQSQTYMVANDAQDLAAARAAAMVTGAPAPEAKAAGQIEIKTVITDTGERKQMFGLPARHLKLKVTEQSSPEACSKVNQSFEVDGWYADLGAGIASCTSVAPPVHQNQGCQDTVIEHHSGTAKPGYPLVQNVALHNADGSTTTVSISVTEVSKKLLDAALFDVPGNYRQVSSYTELMGMPQVPQVSQMAQPQGGQPPMGNPAAAGPTGQQMTQQMMQQQVMGQPGMNPQAMAQQMMAQQMMAQQYAKGGMGNPGNMGMMGGNQPASAPVAAPQALGPKAPGKIRIGVAPPDAQLGQGNNAGADYSTPIRNAIVLLMSGPAIEIAALDSHIPMQLQAEAQQKQCDYILFSSVAVKHQQGGFGKFAKFGGMAASMTPMGAMAHGMGGAVAAQAAASVAAQAAQQQAMNQAMSQLAGFNGQIKSKDDVTVQYSLTQTGQSAPILQNALQGKAKSDGEDVLTPLLQQTANTVLTQVSSVKK